jgi:hypothetical protein
MDEYQLSDLASGVLGNFLTTFAVFLSIVTTHVVAAFVAGSRLTRVQLVTVNFCFVLSTGSIGLLSFLLFRPFLVLVRSMQTLQTEDASGIASRFFMADGSPVLGVSSGVLRVHEQR